MSSWGWTPAKSAGIWRQGAPWLRPFIAAAPWLSMLVILVLFKVVGNALATERGVLFELPDAGVGEAARASLVAIAMPTAHETSIFFDDARYTLGDPVSVAALGEHLAKLAGRDEEKTLWVLADKRIAGGELMRLAGVAKSCGIRKVLFAEKTPEGGAE